MEVLSQNPVFSLSQAESTYSSQGVSDPSSFSLYLEEASSYQDEFAEPYMDVEDRSDHEVPQSEPAEPKPKAQEKLEPDGAETEEEQAAEAEQPKGKTQAEPKSGEKTAVSGSSELSKRTMVSVLHHSLAQKEKPGKESESADGALEGLPKKQRFKKAVPVEGPKQELSGTSKKGKASVKESVTITSAKDDAAIASVKDGVAQASTKEEGATEGKAIPKNAETSKSLRESPPKVTGDQPSQVHGSQVGQASKKKQELPGLSEPKVASVKQGKPLRGPDEKPKPTLNTQALKPDQPSSTHGPEIKRPGPKTVVRNPPHGTERLRDRVKASKEGELGQATGDQPHAKVDTKATVSVKQPHRVKQAPVFNGPTARPEPSEADLLKGVKVEDVRQSWTRLKPRERYRQKTEIVSAKLSGPLLGASVEPLSQRPGSKKLRRAPGQNQETRVLKKSKDKFQRFDLKSKDLVASSKQGQVDSPATSPEKPNRDLVFGQNPKMTSTQAPSKQGLTRTEPKPERLKNSKKPLESKESPASGQNRSASVEQLQKTVVKPETAKPLPPMFRQVEEGLRQAYVLKPKSVNVSLSPEDLGDIKVRVSIENDQVHAKIQTESQKVTALIKDHQADLEQRMKEQDMELHQFDVSEEGKERDGSQRESRREAEQGSRRFNRAQMAEQEARQEGPLLKPLLQPQAAVLEGRPFSFTV